MSTSLRLLCAMFLSLGAFGDLAAACSCGGGRHTLSERAELQAQNGLPIVLAEAVYRESFIGTEEWINPDGELRSSSRPMARILFLVHRGWNWKRPSLMAVTRAGGEPSCGVRVEMGSRVLLMPTRNNQGHWQLGLCAQSLFRAREFTTATGETALPFGESQLDVDWSDSRRESFRREIYDTLSFLRPGCDSVDLGTQVAKARTWNYLDVSHQDFRRIAAEPTFKALSPTGWWVIDTPGLHEDSWPDHFLQLRTLQRPLNLGTDWVVYFEARAGAATRCWTKYSVRPTNSSFPLHMDFYAEPRSEGMSLSTRRMTSKTPLTQDAEFQVDITRVPMSGWFESSTAKP